MESSDSFHAEFLNVRLLGESHGDLRLIITENSLKVDDTASEESFKDHLFATNQYWNFDNTLLDDVNIIDFLALFNERVIFISFESDATKDDLVEDSVCVFQMLEKGQLLKSILNEAHVLVLVIEDAFLEILADERVFYTDLIKVFLA